MTTDTNPERHADTVRACHHCEQTFNGPILACPHRNQCMLGDLRDCLYERQFDGTGCTP